MFLSVDDSAFFDLSDGSLHVTRKVTQSLEAEELPTPVTFSLPLDAPIGQCNPVDHEIRGTSAGQKEVQVNPRASASGDSAEASISFSIRGDREKAIWRLSGSSLIVGVRHYHLDLSFPQPVAMETWVPGLFLRGAVIAEDRQSAAFSSEFESPATVLIDFRCKFAFSTLVRSEAEVRTDLEDMPVLESLAQRGDVVFKDTGAIILLHLLGDLLPFMHSLERRGLSPARTLILYKNYPYAQKDMVQTTLQSRGYQLYGPVDSGNEPEFVAELRRFLKTFNEPTFVIEDGGYVVPQLHRDATLKSFLTRIVGAVEQTTYGARRVEALLERDRQLDRLSFPVISVARAEVKSRYEPWFVAEAACHNVLNLMPPLSWSGMNVLVLGYGAIGQAVFAHLHANRARVSVSDPSALRLVLADRNQAIVTAPDLAQALQAMGAKSPQFIIGTTGYQSVGREHIRVIAPCEPTLVSLSSRQVEFDLEGFQRDAEVTAPLKFDERRIGISFTFEGLGKITVLGDGFPLNFFASQSVPNRHIDPIMGILHACAAELCRPTVLLDDSIPVAGSRDDHLKALPATRLSSDIVDAIVDRLDLFAPMLTASARSDVE